MLTGIERRTAWLKRGRLMTGIELHELEAAQAKLERRRWERDHFSDGTPVALFAGLAPYPEASFGIIYEDEL